MNRKQYLASVRDRNEKMRKKFGQYKAQGKQTWDVFCLLADEYELEPQTVKEIIYRKRYSRHKFL